MNDRQFIRFAFILVSIALAIVLGCTTSGGTGGGGTSDPTSNTNDNQDTQPNDNASNDNTTNDNTDENVNDNTSENTNDNTDIDNTNDNTDDNTNDNTVDNENTNDNSTENDNSSGGGGGGEETPSDFSHVFTTTWSGTILNYSSLNDYFTSTIDGTPGFTGITMDPANNLYVTVLYPAAIYVFADALTLGSNPTPVAEVSGANTQLSDPTSLAIDSTGSRLFVCNSESVLVFDDIAAPSFNHNIPPDRVIEVEEYKNLMDICIAQSGDLYIANGYPDNNILVVNNPGTTDGNVAANRMITCEDFDNAKAVFVDSSDNLYVACNFTIHAFSNASSLDGPQTPDRTVTILNSDNVTQDFIDIIVGTDGTGYMVSTEYGEVFMMDNINTANGEVSATAKFSDVQSAFNLYLIE